MINKQWIHIGLTKKQICFLEKLSKESKFSGGRKFSRTAIVRAFITGIRGLHIDVDKVKTEKQLKARILTAFKL